ncbi:hypothetical protein ILUMI_00202 [Ignelater luminosus]|uniref:Peroxisomal membrane protein PEX16 n=1 Tax=Ignelater luminosus TaxID=2038154 RepID=A0A8K0GNB8_IGNLU|nr:hypothetical protein ILUMI_00202 [Ignelater luminosus]
MSSAIFSLPELYASYKNWISKNPQTASEFETTAKWISYFIAGRIHNSQVVSELVYSLSNLLVLFNDRIINQSQRVEKPTQHESLKVWLTVLEYSEVFLELSATKLWGTKGKWLIIICVQIFKCISRLLLIFHYKENVIEHPPIPVLQRKPLESGVYDAPLSNMPELDNISFVLHHSGKVIRKVDSSPPIAFRTWKPLERSICDNKQTIEQSLIDKQLIAEALYIIKPIVHLSSAACFGNNTWKPWMLSLILDLYSLRLYRTCRKIDYSCLTRKQKLTIQRRTVALILYLLRSPFYDQYSKERINCLLSGMSNKVPLAHIICNPLMKYLPFWQSTYFYMWST